MEDSKRIESNNTVPVQSSTDQNKWALKLQRIQTFEDMHLRLLLLQGIYGFGYERPLQIQQLAIGPCVLGHDVLLQGPSGIGKTTAYSVSILQRLDLNVKDCQALILVQTLESVHGVRFDLAVKSLN